ncbi:copper resistance protein NlpE [Reichenbachiella ulvae]|uniref:Copper resistance protein NlpE n=1 Tax=Reichenbachiella ulvae TaxID=2980104 RepID=A0ABT3CRT8_9BACT|nr:copper resistance protein NlpE [Reichenbachiella ulvae]MCV9386332.1 copper resistance protein NlpE [Reichenbachiella ulvae]
MKRIFNNLLIVSLLAFSLACSESEDPTPHIVGTWEMQSEADYNVPSEYNWFAYEYSLADLGYESYTLELVKNGTFTIKIERIGLSTIADQGTWIHNEEEESLTLDLDGDEIVYSVEQNELDLLKLSQPIQALAISNADLQALLPEHNNSISEVIAYVNSLPQEERDQITAVISYEVLQSFSRAEEVE